MINQELYNIACSCANDSNYLDVIFEGASGKIHKYDVLEYKSGGAFVNCKSRREYLWPQKESEKFNTDFLYVVDMLDDDGGDVRATLVVWSFGGVTIRGAGDDVQDVVVTESLMEHLPSGLRINNVGEMIVWLNAEFLYGTEGDESIFFRVIGGSQGSEGFWLGRKWLADIVEKRVGQKNYLVIEKIRRSPQKALNLQCGFAKIRFVGEKDASEANPAILAQLTLGSSDPNSIINLWKKYNDADESIMKYQQNLAGTLRVESISLKEGRVYAKIQNSSDNIERFRSVYESLKEDYSICISSSSERKELSVKNVNFDCEGRTVSWEWDGVRPHEKLKDVQVKIDFKPWAVQAKRRSEALDAVRTWNIPVKAITDILNKTVVQSFSSPTRQRIPSDMTLRKAFGDSEPNEAQLQALKVCLGTPDIALIQGPPGTGKTSVIRALQNILQTVDRKCSEKPPSVLLTSFQHVAVDNVAAGSKIWGLPVFRFYGSKKDKEQVFEGLQSWQQETASVIEKQMGDLQVESEFAQYEKLMDKLICLKEAESAYDIQSLLMEILSLADGDDVLSSDEVRDLRVWKRRFTSSKHDRTLYTLLMRIRTSPESFADDGPSRISGLLNYFDFRKEILNCPRLERDRKELKRFIHETPNEDDFIWLYDFRNECVNQILTNNAGVADRTLLHMLRTYLENTLIPKIEERVIHSDIYLMQILKDYYDNVEQKSIRNAMLKYAATFAATTQQSKSDRFINMLRDKNFGFDYVIVDEAARANPLDLFIPMTLARKKVILVGDHRQLPQLVDQEILERMEGEDLPPNLKEFMEQSLFESLWDYLQNERNDGITRTSSLNVQYRMPEKLGAFISKNFYKKHISTGKDPKDCEHQVSRYRKHGNGQCMCAAWEHVDGKESGHRSKMNDAEARLIVDRLKEIVDETDETVGVIASYSAQVKHIETLVRNNPVLREALEKGQIQVGSIDAFQGKQFDIVFFSVVRNNKRFDYGFLTKENRLNVAFSRQKKLLVVFGNRNMFVSKDAEEKVPSLKAFVELADSEV